MRMELLGPVRACADDGTPIEVGGVMVRALLARLALAAGQSLSELAVDAKAPQGGGQTPDGA
ncbi:MULTISPECIES: hypothetical protein [unclassified Nonomuraea]|uniref:hypothetical protein n=1 Tax=unclassified Nonomuraea TaxID=2593643 RepID=UPI0033C29D04